MNLPVPGQELVMHVDQLGGSLNLDLRAPSAGEEFLVLAHHGGFVAGSGIDRWGGIHGGAQKASDNLLWVGMEPGIYSLCRASSKSFPSLQARGFAGPECVSGELAPSGSLTLTAGPES